ncbi:hypothetical protein C1H46_002442 [Malus baccata]|uniref:histidinol dehydrogenase n=1 Tax=Malus baccata TaxID=106549 RepID=A0A540NLZ8_MALBA|nr:hypothetical protein C1H46_002442 [Malus baccata]
MWTRDKNFGTRGFSTPPATWKTAPPTPPAVPMSERKRMSPSDKDDLFHVVHKVPAGDSPYVKAKQVQLIDKDPGKAISLFWAAINAGDRVDSALKDMAVVMKQLDRAEEAIEAIKSFRHLCPYDSQESLNNVLVELYKVLQRSGRIEEEIELLESKLKHIDEGIAFCGRRTKTARAQGRKVQITVEQERARILGNLAWAYLQKGDYKTAEEYYLKALSLEPDKNKQCNLAICLMHMNRFTEAKHLLQVVRDSSGNKPMDESYAKSFERAYQMLTELEAQSVLRPIQQDGRSYMFSRRRADGREEANLSVDQGKKDRYFKNLCESRSSFSSRMKDNQGDIVGAETTPNVKTYFSPGPAIWDPEVQFSQPRRSPWGFNEPQMAGENANALDIVIGGGQNQSSAHSNSALASRTSGCPYAQSQSATAVARAYCPLCSISSICFIKRQFHPLIAAPKTRNLFLQRGFACKGITCSMKSYRLSELSPPEVESLKARPRIDFSSIFSTVNPIVDEVRKRGDAAVKEYFDKVVLDNIVVEVSELPDPELDAVIKEAFDVAYDNIYAFHFAQKSAEKSVENMKGVKCKRVARSIGSVGVYVPGGTAVLPSTALMLSVPAQIAGCKTVVLATPPSQDGTICKAISAMAWGTQSCPKVEKIFGPGNQYVTAAKMILQNSEAMVSIDMPAGPSEVLVIADKHASPVHIAADLLSQAEHGPDSQVVLVIAGDGVDVKAIEEEISKQCQNLPRGEFASKALSHSFTVFARDMVEAVSFSNLYAPEHLIINVQDAEKWESFIENAGQWTPESVGDYASGTNHVLPTYGYAKMYGGVSLDSFLKYMTVQSLTEEGLLKLGPYVATMAEVEGLEAHKRAVTLRLKDIEARQVLT